MVSRKEKVRTHFDGTSNFFDVGQAVIEAMDWTYSGYEELARTGNVKNIQEYLSEQVIKCGISVNTFGINDYLLGFLPESFPEDNVEASRNAIKESNRVLMSMDNHILKIGTPLILSGEEAKEGLTIRTRALLTEISGDSVVVRLIDRGGLGDYLTVLPSGLHSDNDETGAARMIYPVRGAFVLKIGEAPDERTPLVAMIP
ncbi:hypothetical protein MJO29_009506 [Puccinia striiformis f. sp. tritici]|uniref:DUF4469 domain-containing protein n=2 Tax=Puccinia striiformis TaxID=27350 RepID=A0A2S4VM24_9BASI|nr:hypothetical protein MJO29_009506 [Puccinia striiformis f. sp. tritici]POW04756.1 hypothetical protein PSHT_11099 [Puccinia striiformis]POW10543.1 hypothetical protein PSTT_05943 [Puccinia striiformis]